MIEVRNVTRTYGKRGSAFQALRGVTFTIPTGATAAIIGKSGSGKSTLMHLMGGLDRPTSGEVLVDGRSLGGLKRREMDGFRARDLGFVFQSFFVEANQSCYQNVALPLEVNNIPLRRRRQLAEKALEQVELFDKSKAKAGTLSGGQKQRLAIARAIVHRPKIILADEPTGNLDSATGDKVVNLLFGLNRRLQCTLVLVTHDEELAARCQYQIVIKDGQVVSVRGPKRPAAAPDASAVSAEPPVVAAPMPVGPKPATPGKAGVKKPSLGGRTIQ
jgi:putative ABC transport system ATP-binding protein